MRKRRKGSDSTNKIGEKTANHDHLIRWASFRMMKVKVKAPKGPILTEISIVTPEGSLFYTAPEDPQSHHQSEVFCKLQGDHTA